MTAASNRERFRAIAHRYRNLPGVYGLREHSVALVIASTSGTITGDGTRSEVVTDITEAGGYAPKVRWLNDQDIAIGQLPSGSVEIGPITPEFSAGGTSLSLLEGTDMATGEVRLLRITGPKHPDGADYTIKDVSVDRALHLKITAVPAGSQA